MSNALKYDQTVTNAWQLRSIAFNLGVSIVLFAATIYCFAVILLNCSNIQFRISTVLACVTAVAITLAVLTNERELHGLVFHNSDTRLPDFSVRSLEMLAWNDRLVFVTGLFFTAFLSVLYTTRASWNLLG